MPATAQQVIAGLYAAFFNRAPDAEGLNYWEEQTTGGNDLNVFNTLAAGFSTHPKFIDLYSGMNSRQFVEAIYVNALGYEGDSDGIDYWVNFVETHNRSDMVASFVHSALNIDLSDPQWNSLTPSEKTAAQNRQDTLTNKADVGIYFTDTLGPSSNITTPNNLDNDSAYQLSILALAGINNTIDSLKNNKAIVDNILLNSSTINIDNLAILGTINVGSSQTGVIEVVFDEDWFAVQLTANTSYLLSASSTDLSTTYLKLYNSQGSSTYKSDSQGYDENAATIGFTPETSGTYYLSVSDLSDDSTGAYTVGIELTGLSDDFSSGL